MEETKAPNIERSTIDMDEVDHLRVQNMLYKIQLEQEKIKVAKTHLANAELREQLASQELKIWEAEYKKKLSNNIHDEIKRMAIDADNGKVVLDIIPAQRKAHDVYGGNGVDVSEQYDGAQA